MESQKTEQQVQELAILIHGRVQGVGFRYFAIEKGLSLGLRGYARNLDDGSVEVLAQGPRPALERLLALLRRGPGAASVSHIDVTWRAPSTHLSGFHVRW